MKKTQAPNTTWRTRARLACLSLTIGAAVHSGFAFGQDGFDAQRKAVAVSPATQDEATILKLLKSGIAENKPTQAIAVTQQWLKQNVVKDPALLYHAGQAAELSGDWKSAASLYRQYLKRADLKSQAASDAVLGTYTLLINQLADTDSAYAFSRSEGHRLAVNAQARQFDRWFLDEAKRRKDHEAVALRLRGLVDAKVPNDLLVALYESDFSWLLSAINDGRLDQGRYSARFIKAVKDLSKSATFDQELALLLDWSISVKAYNMAILAGEQAQPPLAEARSLLRQFPRHALRVQTGWAGSRGRHYRGDPKKYWPLDLEAKLAPVKGAVAKLDAMGQSEYYQSFDPRYYDGYPQLLNTEQARAWVLANPKLANSKTGPALSLDWKGLKAEDAKKLAPLLEQNPSPDAAMIRAIAKAYDGEKKDLDQAVSTLLATEAWRIEPRSLHSAIDQLWHWAGRPGGNAKRDQQIARGKTITEQIKKAVVKKEDPASKRLAEFKKLWQDYRSAAPKIPSVNFRLKQVLSITPEAIGELLRDNSIQAQLMLRKALATGIVSTDPAWVAYEAARSVYTDRYSPCFDEQARRHYGGINRLRNNPEKYRPHPLNPVFHKLLADQLKTGKVEAWVVFGWLNTQFPEDNAESVALAQQLAKSPAWKSLPFEARTGARTWFKGAAMSQGQAAYIAASDPNLICKPLIELSDDADAAAAAAALKATIDGLKKSPIRHEILGLDRLLSKDKRQPGQLADPAVLEQVYELAGPMRSFQADAQFGAHLFNILAKQPDPELLTKVAPFLWRHTEVYHRTLQGMIDLADQFSEDHPSSAQAIARMGLQTIARHTRGHTYFKRETDIPRLKGIRGKATLAMGLIDIPVPKSDPAYEIYQSQGEFVIGNEDSARELYVDNADQLLPIHRKLSVSYLLWVLQHTIDNRDEERQEELAKALMTWMQESASAFSLEQRVALEIAYGDIALQRSLLPEAQKIFSRISANPAYESVFLRHTATLRRVLVERISGDYDAALQTLMGLEAQKVPRLTTEVYYARAEVYYAMEDYQRSSKEVAKVLARNPDHADATILLGRVQLKLQRLIEATEVELGSATEQDSIVPGEKLKVTLNDPTLSVSSGGTDIEVVVETSSGDKEYLRLNQFGDQKTKYRGQINTTLGKYKQEDGVLQLVGDDKIYYAYSERYRKKMPNLGENRGGPIIVASDALMMASARKLLSENEQRIADMRAATEILEQRSSRRLENMDPERVAQVKAEVAARARRAAIEARIKPGNPLYLRVTDPDRGRTPGIDELAVSVSSSSGDLVGRVVLKETGTHTGRFEGQLQTAEAQAIAFGSSAETGRNPNMVISPKTGYPAWRPVVAADKSSTHRFTVDLNDNAALGKLIIEAKDEGYALKRFIVQTAMNPKTWTTVATYPASKIAVDKPWSPSLIVIAEEGLRAARGARSVYESNAEVRRYMQTGWLATPDLAIAQNVAGPSEALPKSVLTAIPWKTRWTDKPAVIAKFQAYFYEPASVTRRFALQLGNHNNPTKDKNKKQQPEFLIAVNGRVITSKDKKALEGAINLKPGVHKIEIWVSGWIEAIGFGRNTKLRANLVDADELVDCPDSFFDPASFPKGVLEQRNSSASIKPIGEEGFEVDFAEGSRARLVRLLFVEQQGPVPSLNRLVLSDAEGGALLPVATDFADLRKNDLLEIITGDRVTVRYVDDRYVTKGRQKHERFLNVAYTDAGVSFADIEPRFSNRHQKLMPYRETYLRFTHGKELSVVIDDADMDVSTQPDKLTCKVTNEAGETRVLEAVETGASTGVFRAWITPVLAKTSSKEQIQVAEGGLLSVTYLDAENLTPGVPYERVASIRHAAVKAPRIEIAHATITDWQPIVEPGKPPRDHTQALNERLDAWDEWAPEVDRRDFSDRIKTRFLITQTLLAEDDAPDGGLQVVHGRHMSVQVVAPHMALGAESIVEVFVQTDRGRKAAGKAQGSAFDVNVPGTLRFVGTMAKLQRTQTPERGGYVARMANRTGTDYERAKQRLEDGRFRVTVPLVTGPLPNLSYADPEEIRERRLKSPRGLAVKTGERVHIGVAYTDKDGKKRWATTSAKVITRPMLDVMKEDYREPIDSAHVGERLSLRVVDLSADKTEERDSLRLLIASKSGEKHYVNLRETDAFSGVFKGSVQLTYATKKEAEAAAADKAYDVRRQGFPVIYGDTVGTRYTDPSGRQTPVQYVKVLKGSDGTIAPFSKQYSDEATAMRTQFAMAESFLELARRHRKLGEEEQAKREFNRARQLLANTIARFNDADTRAHAEYLLGNLTMEDAETTEDKKLKQRRYQAALARYMKVTGTYPDTAYASKAQFKTAILYERLGEPDIAAQEYVKLAYKHPESEHLATAMARLGTHFQRKAVGFEKQAAPLLAEEEDKDKLFKGEVLKKRSQQEYTKAAQIFERLQERFPNNDLAGKAGLRAGQIYMRADDYRSAAKALQAVIDEEAYDGATLRAEAMYWAGRCYVTLKQPLQAYALYKRITYDFPESKWAAYAKAQLSTDSMIALDNKLELERLEAGQ